jgi:hypothetical protein
MYFRERLFLGSVEVTMLFTPKQFTGISIGTSMRIIDLQWHLQSQECICKLINPCWRLTAYLNISHLANHTISYSLLLRLSYILPIRRVPGIVEMNPVIWVIQQGNKCSLSLLCSLLLDCGLRIVKISRKGCHLTDKNSCVSKKLFSSFEIWLQNIPSHQTL